jgi:hypothetical protein
MNPFELPWSALLIPLAVLLMLFLREVLLFIRIPRFHPERRMAAFNTIVLLGLFIAGVFGMRTLMLRDSTFVDLFPRYPHARYAPERELFSDGSTHIYVTADDPVAVIGFYTNTARGYGYQVTLDDHAKESGRAMFVRGKTVLFLTVMKEGNVTVLYVSENGSVTAVER